MSTFDQVKFEAHRALAERLKPKQQVYVLARELLMLCDEIARLQLRVQELERELAPDMPEEPVRCPDCNASQRNYLCPKHTPQETAPCYAKIENDMRNNCYSRSKEACEFVGGRCAHCGKLLPVKQLLDGKDSK